MHQLEWDEEELETRVMPAFDGRRTAVMDSVPAVANDQPPLTGLSVPPLREDKRRSGFFGWLVALAIASGVCAGIVMKQSATLRVELAEQTRIATAEVFVDGRRRCASTPCIVRDLAPGEHTVRIVAPDHPPTEVATVSLRPFAQGRVTLSLAEQSASLHVDGAHPGITVECDGKARGALPVVLDELTPGTHTLRFEGGPRYHPRDRTIALRAGETLDLGRVALDLRTGSVEVDVEPERAQAWLRGEEGAPRLLSGPYPRTLELAPGDYELVVARRGYRSVVRPLRVDSTRPEQRLHIVLKPTDWARDDIWEQ